MIQYKKYFITNDDNDDRSLYSYSIHYFVCTKKMRQLKPVFFTKKLAMDYVDKLVKARRRRAE